MFNNDDKGLVQIKENLLNKIKKFFKSVFKQEIEYNCEKGNDTVPNITKEKENTKTSIFTETIKVEEDMNQRLLRLQKLIREKRISENELGDEDKANLRKLYETQIEELRTSILQKRYKIMKIKYDKLRKAHASNS